MKQLEIALGTTLTDDDDERLREICSQYTIGTLDMSNKIDWNLVNCTLPIFDCILHNNHWKLFEEI